MRWLALLRSALSTYHFEMLSSDGGSPSSVSRFPAGEKSLLVFFSCFFSFSDIPGERDCVGRKKKRNERSSHHVAGRVHKYVCHGKKKESEIARHVYLAAQKKKGREKKTKQKTCFGLPMIIKRVVGVNPYFFFFFFLLTVSVTSFFPFSPLPRIIVRRRCT